MPISYPYLVAFRAILVFGCVSVCGCRKTEPAAQPASPPAATPEPAPAPPAAEPAQVPAAPAPSPQGPPEGWSKVSHQDSLELCVFSSMDERERALSRAAVKKQALKANEPLVFGVFPPWCLNEACDQHTTMQCWAEREGESTWVVHSRFSSTRKDNADCKTDCTEIDTMCQTAELKSGQYTIRHGDKTYQVKIPSTLKEPCKLASAAHK